MYISNNAELAENKLTILYISRSVGLPITNTRLTQLINDGNFFNFFLLQHLLEDLISNNYIKKGKTPDDEATYLITTKGSETLNFLMHKLPKGVRKHIDKLTDLSSEAIRKDREILSYIKPENHGSYLSVLEIKDNEDLLFSINYSSGTKNDAMAICDNLKANAEKLYNLITKEILK